MQWPLYPPFPSLTLYTSGRSHSTDSRERSINVTILSHGCKVRIFSPGLDGALLQRVDLCSAQQTAAPAPVQRSAAPVPLVPAPVKSPQVEADGNATFTLAMPNAAKVELHLENVRQPFAMTKGADGAWTVTVPKLAPQYYSYAYGVDGTSVIDPHNVT